MKKMITWGSLIFTISCANPIITAPTSLPNKVDNVTVSNNTPGPITTPTATHGIINIHVINGATGNSVQSAEISANGRYFGNTNGSGDYSADFDYGVTYDFTIYQGEYKVSHEKHTFNKDNNSFISMLTSLR